MKRLLVAVGCVALLTAFGCKRDEQQTDTPAGHPDELRDSTRLDSAPVQPDTSNIRINTAHDDTAGPR